jgi:hypothetical protein
VKKRVLDTFSFQMMIIITERVCLASWWVMSNAQNLLIGLMLIDAHSKILRQENISSDKHKIENSSSSTRSAGPGSSSSISTAQWHSYADHDMLSSMLFCLHWPWKSECISSLDLIGHWRASRLAFPSWHFEATHEREWQICVFIPFF